MAAMFIAVIYFLIILFYIQDSQEDREADAAKAAIREAKVMMIH